jgi:hypothetical protein
MGVFSHDGRRVISFLRPAGPTRAVLRAYASEGSRGALSFPTKSANDGPAFNLSLNVVRLRAVVVVEGLVADGEGSVVA